MNAALVVKYSYAPQAAGNGSRRCKVGQRLAVPTTSFQPFKLLSCSLIGAHLSLLHKMHARAVMRGLSTMPSSAKSRTTSTGMDEESLNGKCSEQNHGIGSLLTLILLSSEWHSTVFRRYGVFRTYKGDGIVGNVPPTHPNLCKPFPALHSPFFCISNPL